MPKIKEIREIKSKIREIEPKIKIKENADLEEDIEKAEEEFSSKLKSSPKTPPLEIMGSDVKFEEEKRTQIQEENQARTELKRTNVTRAREYARARPAEEERGYSSTQMAPQVLTASRRFGVQETSKGILRESAQSENQQTSQIVEREEHYKVMKSRKKTYPWET